ncbi:MAG: DHH family phosphoesterase [Candidatus Saliniplasma sp.]
MVELPKGLEKKYESALGILDSYDKFRIISHYDGDGISAASVLALTLMRENKGFHARFVSKIPENLPKDLPIILTDIGNSHLRRIKDIDEPVIVLDHHKVDESIESEDDEHVYINPHDHDIDGSSEVSGGTLALLLSELYDKKNVSLSLYGLAGAAADKQNLNGFKGMNSSLLDEALEREELIEKEGLFIDGEDIKEALMKAGDPYFPGISGRKKDIEQILEDLDIDPETPVEDIPSKAERKLNTLLVVSLIETDIPSQVIESIRGCHYISNRYGTSVDILYKLLNSAARTKQAGLGMSICLGDKDALEKTKEIRKTYREKMVERLQDLEEEGPTEKVNIQYFFEEKKERKGELAGLAMLYIFDQSKPTLGICELDDDIDISARGTRKLVDKGLDLGMLCRETAKKFDGRGGGHDIAAGATVSKEYKDDFLDDFDRRVAKTLDKS